MKFKSNPSLTILSLVFGLLVIYVFVYTKEILYLCIAFSGLSILSTKISILIERVWFKFSYVLSLLIPNVLFTLNFFLILTPLALLSRFFNNESEFEIKNKKNLFLEKKINPLIKKALIERGKLKK